MQNRTLPHPEEDSQIPTHTNPYSSNTGNILRKNGHFTTEQTTLSASPAPRPGTRQTSPMLAQVAYRAAKADRLPARTAGVGLSAEPAAVDIHHGIVLAAA